MITNTAGTVTTSGSLGTESTEMSLDADGMAHLMGVLTNLYSDKSLAVLREYSTNALDAHLAAGQTAPIEVTLPTALNPSLVITDHGVGLSREQIVNVYARYGASTKRDSNTQIGSFGLGAKSAFTIGSQFVVTATKDERRTVAVFALNTHGVGTVNILDERSVPGATNGVTVDIAVTDWRAMHEAAGKLFRYWAPGTVLVDGKVPETVWDDTDGIWISDTILFNRETSGLTVVMGGVGYRLPGSAVNAVRDRLGAAWSTWGDAPRLTVFMPIGSVDITPSREAVRDTDRTIHAVADALTNLNQHIEDRLTEIKAASPNTTAFVLAAKPLMSMATWLNIKLDSVLPPAVMLDAKSYRLGSRGGLSTHHDSAFQVSASWLHQVRVLVGVPEGKSARRHAKAWLEEDRNDRNYTLIQVGDGAALSGSVGWLSWGGEGDVPTVAYDSIELPEVERGTSSSREVRYEAYDVHAGKLRHLNYSGVGLTLAQIRADGRAIAYTDGSVNYLERNVGALTDHLILVHSARQTETALLRRFPNAVTVSTVVNAWRTSKLAKLGDLEPLTYAYGWAMALAPIIDMLGDRISELTSAEWTSVLAKAAPFRSLSEDDQELLLTHAYVNSAVRNHARDYVREAFPVLMFVADHKQWSTPDTVIDAAIDHTNKIAA